LFCWSVLAQQQTPSAAMSQPSEQLQQEFFVDFNLTGVAADVEQFLRVHPGDVSALFLRMETAALQARSAAVLDSALRLCNMSAPDDIQEIASSRILEHATNSRGFADVFRRVGLAMDHNNKCTFNLRLALVAAAADGAPNLDLDKTAESAGLLTHWTITGPYGRYSNVDFDKQWPPESPRFWTKAQPATETFVFRDGMMSLPDYLSAPGIFYATSRLRTAEAVSRLEILSPGPYIIVMDGKRVLDKDSRLVAGSNRQSILLKLSPGEHRIMVKFTEDAVPLSLDLHPEVTRRARLVPVNESPAMRAYIRTLAEYFRGDLNAVAQTVAQHSNQSGIWGYLRAILWSAAEENSVRSRAAWEKLAQAEPSALLARVKVAEVAAHQGISEELRAEARKLAQQRPESESVAELQVSLAREHPSEFERGITHLVELHPSCSHLLQALQFYTAAEQELKAVETEQRLNRCAPGSLDYAKVLTDSGRHREAAAFLTEKLIGNPLNRRARRMLVEELVLAGEMSRASDEAKRLASIARLNRGLTELASDPALLLDSSSPRQTNFASGKDFYSNYRRDALAIVRSSKTAAIKNGSSLLVQDRVIKIRASGSASVYAHRLRRLNDNQAIARYGQIQLPQGADLLELRTIKADGRVVEPELPQKGSISMPALEPGACIEEEYVTHYPDWRQIPHTFSVFQLGAVDVPVEHTRLLVIFPRNTQIEVREMNAAPAARNEVSTTDTIRIWEAENVPAFHDEPFARSGDLLPSVAITDPESGIERLRDGVIDAVRIGPHVIDTLAAPGFASTLSDREKAERLYRFVTARIDSTGPSLEGNSAEDALSSGEGSRTAALLALARASGLRTQLIMAQRLENRCTQPNMSGCPKEPLVRFLLPTETVDVDAENDELPFGAIASTVDLQSAMLVPLSPANATEVEPIVVKTRPVEQRSVGEGDLFLKSDGNLAAAIHLRLGAERGREIREVLRGTNEQQRQNFFNDFAARILPGAVDVQGEATNAGDPDRPLELNVSCTVPQFMTAEGVKSIGQLAPVLGLPAALARTANRRSALYLDTPFSENTVFYLHLPPGFSTLGLPQNFSSNSEFGRYSVEFSWSAGQLEVKREFDIPAQLVEPDAFSAFAEFVRGINAAERQQINLVHQTRAETRVYPVTTQ
jgi:hypothetical protein